MSFFSAMIPANSSLKNPALAAIEPAISAAIPYSATLSVPGTKSA